MPLSGYSALHGVRKGSKFKGLFGGRSRTYNGAFTAKIVND